MDNWRNQGILKEVMMMTTMKRWLCVVHFCIPWNRLLPVAPLVPPPLMMVSVFTLFMKYVCAFSNCSLFTATYFMLLFLMFLLKHAAYPGLPALFSCLMCVLINSLLRFLIAFEEHRYCNGSMNNI